VESAVDVIESTAESDSAAVDNEFENDATSETRFGTIIVDSEVDRLESTSDRDETAVDNEAISDVTPELLS
jgi:hypothetical protein